MRRSTVFAEEAACVFSPIGSSGVEGKNVRCRRFFGEMRETLFHDAETSNRQQSRIALATVKGFQVAREKGFDVRCGKPSGSGWALSSRCAMRFRGDFVRPVRHVSDSRSLFIMVAEDASGLSIKVTKEVVF